MRERGREKKEIIGQKRRETASHSSFLTFDLDGGTGHLAHVP